MLEYLSNTCRVSSSGRATASQAVGGGFESRILLQDLLPYIPYGRSKGRSCGAFCFYRPPGGVFFVLASLYFYLDLYPPSTLLSESPLPLRGSPLALSRFLRRGAEPACKNRSAAPGCRCPNMQRGSPPACIFGRLPLLRLACFCRRQRLSYAASFASLFLPQAALGSAAPLRGELACGFSLTQKEQLPV